MELEFHQLDLRYERLRVRQLARERRLLASLADAGQQMPIVVVGAGTMYVVVDGHKRVRCLRQLHRDLVAAVAWEMSEPEALIFRQLLRTDATDSAFEQGWLLRTLHDEHGVALDLLARRFDRSVSWVSHRPACRDEIPRAVGARQRGRLRAARRRDRAASTHDAPDWPAVSALRRRAGGHARARPDRPLARAPPHRRHPGGARPP
jgi:ParB family transcriptional regulator, chromosome partitioning protein